MITVPPGPRPPQTELASHVIAFQFSGKRYVVRRDAVLAVVETGTVMTEPRCQLRLVGDVNIDLTIPIGDVLRKLGWLVAIKPEAQRAAAN